MPKMRSLQSSAQKANPSHLLSSIQSQYSALTVNALKKECKTRGLRVSGRKSELVDRIVAFEATQQYSTVTNGKGAAIGVAKPPAPPSAPAASDAAQAFSTSAPAEAKNDSSSIDYFRLPDDAFAIPPANELPTRMVVPPDADYKAVEHAPRRVEPRIPDESGTAKIHDISGSKVISTITENDGDPKTHSDEDGEPESSGISSRDKTILWGLVAGVAAWWTAGSLLSSRKHKNKE